MEFQITWSPQAIDDLEELIGFISANNPVAARALAFRIVDRIESLARHPLLGSVFLTRPRWPIRKLLVVPFQVFYTIHRPDREVKILRIWHSARRDPIL